MILPFIVPLKNEVINISQIVSIRDNPLAVGLGIDVTFVDGSTRKFTGEAATIIQNEVMSHVEYYASFKRGLAAASSQIITNPGMTM